MRYISFEHRLLKVQKVAENWSERVFGTSLEGRPIVGYLRQGEGPRIMAWALMHGNEPTGYEALVAFMDLNLKGTWCIIPILNPDGAEAFTRLNAEGLDVNRDARAQVTAEAQALEACRQWFKPEIALNLHDQRPRFYPTGGTLPASFSLLAPKGHPELMTDSQRKAQAILHAWTGHLQSNFPGQLARFDDAFYPTAFGEYFQETGCATITLETGIAPKDWGRTSVARAEMECLALLDAHAHEWLASTERTNYLELPMNASPANEWTIQHVDGHCHLRLHETQQDGEYVTRWEVDEYLPDRPTWITSTTSTSLKHLAAGTLLTEAYLSSLGISVPDIGLKN